MLLVHGSIVVYMILIEIHALYFYINRSRKAKIMSSTEDRDNIFCRKILVSNLFPTKKYSAERGKVWDSLIAEKLSEIRQPSFRVDQMSVRDHYKK